MTQVNILDDDNISIDIDNDIYTFNLTKMVNYCINVTDCFECLTTFDVADGDTIYFGGFTRTTVNQELNCTCPIGSVTSTSIDTATVTVVTLKDGKVGYMGTLNVNSISVNDSSCLITIAFADSLNCDLIYYVNGGSYLNITALYIVHVILSISTDIVNLTNIQINELENKYGNCFDNYYNAENQTAVSIQKIIVCNQTQQEEFEE